MDTYLDTASIEIALLYSYFVSMRNYVIAFLILGLLLPTFLPFAPHVAVHAMYDAHIVRHLDSSPHNGIEIDHSHGTENDLYTEHEDIDHHVPTDFASYYKDFLHIDLKNTDQANLISKLISVQDIGYDLTVDIAKTRLYKTTSHMRRGPPVGHVYKPNSSSLYLTTLRIRI